MSALPATEVRILLNRGDSASTATILAAAADLGLTGQLSSGSKGQQTCSHASCQPRRTRWCSSPAVPPQRSCSPGCGEKGQH